MAIEKIKGYGAVGTWVSPKKLGGALPEYLSDTEREAVFVAPNNKRLMGFIEDIEVYLCEITIKPIKKLKLSNKPIFVEE